MRSSTTTPTTAAEAERYIGEHPRAGEVVLLQHGDHADGRR